jgi:hypothetical protein
MLEVCLRGARTGDGGASLNRENPPNCDESCPSPNRVPVIPKLAGTAPRKGGAPRRLFPALPRWANLCRAHGADGELLPRAKWIRALLMFA